MLFSIIKGSRRKGRRERKTKHMVGVKNSSREKIERNHSLQKEKEKWQPTPVFLPRESQGQRSLVGYIPWGYKESDMTEVS